MVLGHVQTIVGCRSLKNVEDVSTRRGSFVHMPPAVVCYTRRVSNALPTCSTLPLYISA